MGVASACGEALALVVRAAAFAARAHRDQRRKGRRGEPAINHGIEVARILVDEAGERDPALLAAALLHDTVEDTDTTLADIERRFGAEVAALVAQVSDDPSLPRHERRRRQLEAAAGLEVRAKRLRLADKIANVRALALDPPPGWSARRRREYVAWCRAVVDRLRGVQPALERAFDEAYERALERFRG
ncbi:MAG: bifunctional (p)ppGpp synthetase/guanosine-3',5'-bis(diphosphate) 3'-pyrophosphohydrolase [Planctomycetota bacterium]|nr:MAG: bifunctional (p)ppGpp synthetase/guanosine-3',5'-bis(diphosphate) 3'-pyrophosphohydrolase [Planctomycetota bacterium]